MRGACSFISIGKEMENYIQTELCLFVEIKAVKDKKRK